MRSWDEGPLHVLGHTRQLVRGLVSAPTNFGSLLRGLIFSPNGRRGDSEKQKDLFPLPMPCEWREALVEIAGQSCKTRKYPKRAWFACEKAWCGLILMGLNWSHSFTTTVGSAVSPMQEKVLELVSRDAVAFVKGDGLGKDGARAKAPEVPWKTKIGDLSVNYVGDVVEKARWLTWEQMEPGLPPKGFGASLDACCFCSPWVKRHLVDPSLTRIPDDQITIDLPHAVVRSTQDQWNTIARELVQREVACVIPAADIAQFKGQPILNGAFGVVKPGRWIGDPLENRPVLRLIMDFRAANMVHRELPGGVHTLVGPSKWQGFVLEKGEVLVSSGDDLVSSFYLFRIPYEWSKYFAFRKMVQRGVLQVPGDPNEWVYVASCVLPMGWTAAVTVMQHIHRSISLVEGGLPADREIRRDRRLPRKRGEAEVSFWNLYIDDLTVLEIIQERALQKGGGLAGLQMAMQSLYDERGVPYSAEKSTSRQLRSEKLGALIDGDEGILGVTTKRVLEFISLLRFVCTQERIPTKWIQIVLGKFVHIMQFRRPIFSCVQVAWDRLKFHDSHALRPSEVEEWQVLQCLLPLCRTNLRARVSGTVTASDASETGGGLCMTTGLTPLGIRGSTHISEEPREAPILVIEWFAGIGRLSQALSRLGIKPLHVAVCECDDLAVLRRASPGCTVWKDIKRVSRKELVELLDRFPNVEGIVFAGGSPCQGLSQLSALRQHFTDVRSGLFFELVRVMVLTKELAKERKLWYFGFVENVVCDESDQKIFREQTGWRQYLACSGQLSVVRRPRFFWVSHELQFPPGVEVEPKGDYELIRYFGPLEPDDLWVSSGWEWCGSGQGVSLPTFTRSIPRKAPPFQPAGIAACDADTRRRWKQDAFRYPPYTYQPQYCLSDGYGLRVAGPAEREILMGFPPGHTAVKIKSYSRMANNDERCAAVGNSFHTGVVANILRDGLSQFIKEIKLPDPTLINILFQTKVREYRQECYSTSSARKVEGLEDWMERLEQDVPVPPPPLRVEVSTRSLIIERMMELLTYRGTDIHVDTLQFYRPDRLPTSSVSPFQWHWKTVKGWPWRYDQHINVLEMEALYRSLKWRSRSLQNYGARFLHLTDSQVVLGIVSKGRTNSQRLIRSLHRYNLLVLAMHSQPILGWVASEDNPADAPCRWFEPQ